MSDQPVTPEAPAAPAIDENQIIAERRAKLQALRAKGNPYPNKFWRENLVGDLAEKYEDRDRDWLDVNPVVVKVAGRMMLKLSLIHISEPTRLLSTSYAVFCLKKK